MIGQSYSISQNASMLTLVGGPYDGERGLFDHSQWQSIQFSDCKEKVTHIYKPSKVTRTFAYEGAHAWDEAMIKQEEINKILDDRDGFERQMEGMEDRLSNLEYDLENLLWEDMIEKGMLEKEQIELRERYPRSPELIIYTDRDKECNAGSPTGHCIEMGWHDSCVYCKSNRDDD